jgi:hypothetical protein
MLWVEEYGEAKMRDECEGTTRYIDPAFLRDAGCGAIDRSLYRVALGLAQLAPCPCAFS